MSAYTMWYREGTVGITQNTYQVTGVSTYWLSAGISPGDMFTTDGSNFYEIAEITDSAHIELKTPYLGDSLTDSKYAVIRNFNSGMSSRVSALAAQLLGYFDRYIDADMQSIHGRSAYEEAVQNGYTGTVTEWLESLNAYGVAVKNGFTGTKAEWLESLNAYGVAVKNGFTGTKAEWLESLKAAGEWSTLNARTSILTSSVWEVHNSIAGFRNKGTVFTDEHKAALKNKTFDDLYIGDYWTINGHKYWIAKFSFGAEYGGAYTILMLSNILYTAQMNETDTNAGGYYNSWLANTGLEQAGEILTTDWGSLLLRIREYMPASNASGYVGVSSDFYPKYKCIIPTYRMMYGRPFTKYPQDWISFFSHTQLPIAMFSANRNIQTWGGDFWYQECYNGTDSFVMQGDHGVRSWQVDSFKASQTHGVRVLFLIGLN